MKALPSPLSLTRKKHLPAHIGLRYWCPWRDCSHVNYSRSQFHPHLTHSLRASLATKPCQIKFENISCNFLGFYFILMIVSFAVKKHFRLTQSCRRHGCSQISIGETRNVNHSGLSPQRRKWIPVSHQEGWEWMLLMTLRPLLSVELDLKNIYPRLSLPRSLSLGLFLSQ